jgi:hypothetical protein
MEEPVEFEWMRGNLFKITDPNTGITRIAEAAVISEIVARANRALDAWHERQNGKVVRLPKR